ncbi:/ / hypothetical protein / 199737:201281 Forward [Candidatus Hepatoplasma crinochetorum]|uniref:Uncharacterized protein n=1 Tax=Candidatus Hepatoplasma crinochetorum TaxID=295596 RepID=A0A0G7ZNK6_9MOLU|nr:/ / hypothetical protein / 199737:201281 Forward [Candidatus Hepatoplasma crinochetorum]
MKIKMKKFFIDVEWTFFLVILFSLLIPFTYKFIRYFWLSKQSIDYFSNILGILSTITLVFETATIFLVVPVYAFVNKNIKNKQEQKEKFIISFVIVFVALIFINLLMAACAYPYVMYVLGADNQVNQLALTFMISSIGFSFLLFDHLFVAFLILKRDKIGAFFLTILGILILFLSDFFLISGIFIENPGYNIISISFLLGPLFYFFLIFIWIFLREFKEWKAAFKSFSFKKWKGDLKIYKKTSLFVGIETLIWNSLWFLGVSMPLYMSVDQPYIETAFVLSDAMFWTILTVPLTAFTYLQAERHSRVVDQQEHNFVLFNGFIFVFFIGISWLLLAPLVIFLIYPHYVNFDSTYVILNLRDFINMNDLNGGIRNLPTILQSNYYDVAYGYIRSFCLIMLPFFYMMLIIRVIYTYWVAVGNSFKALLGTIIGAGMVWIPSTIIFTTLIFTGVDFSPYFIVFAYGIGILMMAIVYSYQLYLENKRDVSYWNWYKKWLIIEENNAELENELLINKV